MEVVSAIEAIWNHRNASRITIINMSLGGPGVDSLMDEYISESVNRGIYVVVAAGNDGKNACNYYPSHSKDAITVGSVDDTDKISLFSNTGSCVDIFTRGYYLQTTASNGATIRQTGTSFAAPLASGVLAVLASEHPTIFSDARKGMYAFLNLATTGKIKGVIGGTPNKLVFVNETNAIDLSKYVPTAISTVARFQPVPTVQVEEPTFIIDQPAVSTSAAKPVPTTTIQLGRKATIPSSSFQLASVHLPVALLVFLFLF